MQDAGITLDEVEGIVSAPGPIGDTWGPNRPYFAPPYDSEDGITKVTAEWLVYLEPGWSWGTGERRGGSRGG